MQTHNARIMSLIPPSDTIDTPLARKATGNHLLKSTSLERLLSPVSATLKIEYVTQLVIKEAKNK